MKVTVEKGAKLWAYNNDKTKLIIIIYLQLD